MIDIHCHILPGVDDGAQTEKDSIDMALSALEQGIHTIIATPHHKNGKYENDCETVKKQVAILQDLFINESIPLTLLAGQEVRINGDMISDIRTSNILPLNNTKYVFVEFASNHVPRYAKQMLFDIQVEGYVPVIVHPERNSELIQNPDMLYKFVQNGALTQVTAASMIGKFGKAIQKFSHQLVEANLTHFIASDAHNTTSRGFSMKEAYQELSNRFDNETAYLFMENSQLLIDGQNVNKLEPEKIRKKKRFGFF